MENGSGARRVYSVSELNRHSRELLETAFPSVWVEGEISNFSAPSSGHWYFTLKDEQGQLRCAMFRNRNARTRLRPRHGERLLVRGTVSLYTARGEYQMIVEEIEAAGAGALQRALEALRERLAAEGLFAPAHKRALPRFPQHLGVVTSATGAALHDILTVLRRRYPSLVVSVFPVAVQGEGAAAQIAAAIASANRWAATLDPPLDVLIVGRGGGSLEDLWAFNEEIVARAIHASTLPVISAVGHETDFTIADLVADVRAPTPSAAAELLAPDRTQLLRALAATRQRLLQLARRELDARTQRLDWLARRLRHPGARLRDQAQRLDDLELRLRAAITRRLTHTQARLAHAQGTLAAHSPERRLDARHRELGQLGKRLASSMRHLLAAREARFANLAHVLGSVSPLATLARGYAIVSDTAGHVLRDAHEVTPGQRVRARIAHASLECTVDAVQESV
ncbi:MAG: Exodeoxyribonuclease 7 large subunit [Pseudomonadales bacterium]|nr:Exodeoxyribonuclease 7 large subunit [Pseudomonadales bacterium]